MLEKDTHAVTYEFSFRQFLDQLRSSTYPNKLSDLVRSGGIQLLFLNHLVPNVLPRRL